MTIAGVWFTPITEDTLSYIVQGKVKSLDAFCARAEHLYFFLSSLFFFTLFSCHSGFIWVIPTLHCFPVLRFLPAGGR